MVMQRAGKHLIKRRGSWGYALFSVCNTLFMLLMIFVTAYPMYYCLVASVSEPAALTMHSGGLWWPAGEMTLRAYEKVFQHPQLLSGFRNTLFLLVVGTAINMLLTAATAYPLSRKGMMLNRPVTLLIVFTMYFSGGMIPGYLNIQSLGLLDSLWSLILPGAISTYNMIIMRTAFAALPDSLVESAQLDGANHLTILWKIMIPLTVPTIAVLVLYYGVAHWTSWFNASIYLSTASKFPLQLVMRNILDTAGANEMMGDVSQDAQASYAELIKYALIVVSTAPILLLYPFLQKYFVKGIMIGAVKG